MSCSAPGASRRSAAKAGRKALFRDQTSQLGLPKGLDHASSRITRLLRGKDGDAVGAVAANAAATAVRLSVQLAGPPRLNKTNLHPYRLKVKRLQNILRLAEAPSGIRFIKDLGDVMDSIGHWHDWEELVGIASKLLNHALNCLLLAEVKRIAESKYDHALSLGLKFRKTYLQSNGGKTKNHSGSGASRPLVWEAMARLAG
jgi:hypothetical protein